MWPFGQFCDKVNLAWITHVLEECSFYALWLVHRVLKVDLLLTSILPVSGYQVYLAHADFAERGWFNNPLLSINSIPFFSGKCDLFKLL